MNACNAEHQQLVKDCEARVDRLSAWEAGFILSCKERLQRGASLTDTQSQKLNEIWDRCTERG